MNLYDTLGDAQANGTERIALYQKQLPKLDALDLIGWDEDTETLTAGEALDDIQPLIEATQKIE